MFSLLRKWRLSGKKKDARRYVNRYYIAPENIHRRNMELLCRALGGEDASLLGKAVAVDATYESHASGAYCHGLLEIQQRFRQIKEASKCPIYAQMGKVSLDPYGPRTGELCIALSYGNKAVYNNLVFAKTNEAGKIHSILIFDDSSCSFALDGQPEKLCSLERKSSEGIRYSLAGTEDILEKHERKAAQDAQGGAARSGEMFSLDDEPEESADAYNAAAVACTIGKRGSGRYALLLSQLEKNINQTFVEKVMFYIDRKNMKDSAVYKAAQIDRRLFSKIMSDRRYKPAKDTAIAISVALMLTLDETSDLLARAGYTLSHSSTRDIIIEYCILEHIFNLNDINEILYSLQQKLIGR